jgi:hypothetical protein
MHELTVKLMLLLKSEIPINAIEDQILGCFGGEINPLEVFGSDGAPKGTSTLHETARRLTYEQIIKIGRSSRIRFCGR